MAEANKETSGRLSDLKRQDTESYDSPKRRLKTIWGIVWRKSKRQ